jgi:transcriptional antiterminator RfaH
MNRIGIVDPEEPAWYCLRAKSKREHLAAAHLRSLAGVTVFCPRIRFKRQTRQGPVWVTEAMFPSYLFARFELSTMLRQVEYTQDVRGIVRFADEYPTIEDEVLAQLREHVGVQEVKELAYAASEGDNVTIAAGAFAGLEAVVTQVLPAKERVKVLVEFLGREIEAEVECCRILHRSEQRTGAISELEAACLA